MREVFFVSCTAGRREDTPLWRSLRKLGATAYQFFEHNRQGLPACYNGCLDQHVGTDKILALVHDDVTVGDVFFQEKLNEAVLMFDVVGAVGSAYFDPEARPANYTWSAWPRQYLSGAVEHEVGPGLNVWTCCGLTPRRCILLDGLFLAVDLLTIGPVRFDERFDFHCYDLDFCLSAHQAGLVLGTSNVYLQHLSRGDYASDTYGAAMRKFQDKWGRGGMGKVVF